MIDLGVKSFEKNKKEYIADYDKDRYNEEKGTTYRINVEKVDVEVDFEGGEMHIQLSSDNPDFYQHITIKPDPDMIIAMSEIVVKEYNRARTFFESRPR